MSAGKQIRVKINAKSNDFCEYSVAFGVKFRLPLPFDFLFPSPEFRALGWTERQKRLFNRLF